MTATTQDRNTPMKDGELIVVPVAAGAVIPAGTLVVAGATGFAVPGSTATGLAFLGRAEEYANNTGGTDGAVSVPVRRGKAFKWANDSSDPVTQASLGRPCFISDNQTVAKTNGTNTRSQAGIVLGLDADGVWVI
ncbi:hypothetical protein [Laribacter hongkongensis]|uniref:Uncharacterized protein n=1 Tax=Laribacter hongkongensis TaxID=168471 RepID=A0ABD4SUY2_9NEIS|nr:hypothetical protein [Laribacter hongkongensis]MCG9027433.1 hypothetical protein [Laribacter hongkongensis]